MVLKAKFVLPVSDAFSGNTLSASAQGVEVLDEFKQCLQGRDVAVRAEIGAHTLVYLSCVDDARQVLVGDADAWVGFTVFQQYIVTRIPLFYQVVLQKQGILLGVYYNIFYVVNL